MVNSIIMQLLNGSVTPIKSDNYKNHVVTIVGRVFIKLSGKTPEYKICLCNNCNLKIMFLYGHGHRINLMGMGGWWTVGEFLILFLILLMFFN